MAQQAGRTLLVQVEDSPGAGTYSNVCGLRTRNVTINNNSVDTTTPDCTTPGGPLWRKVREGIKQVTISGDGIFEDSTTEKTVYNGAIAADPTLNFKITIPDLATLTGNFLIASMEYGGDLEGSATYSLSLENNGEITSALI